VLFTVFLSSHVLRRGRVALGLRDAYKTLNGRA
jgi:hypothetical protein